MTFRSFLLAVSLLAPGVVPGATAQLAPVAAHGADPAFGVRGGVPKNLVFFIADGCGFATFTMARDYAREILGRDQVFDAVHTGSVVTRASDARVTDSAAGATAFASGILTKNGRIGTDDDARPVATVLEEAEKAGYWTGLVTTTRITHATPAAYSAHVASRADEAEIADQQIRQGIEVLLGGGTNHFRGEGAGGTREDGRDLVAEAEALGYRFVDDVPGLSAIDGVPVLGLFNASHVDYEIDRAAGDDPSLAEMTRKALELLAGSPDGFFLMIEAGRIDHAGHGNDPAAHLHDTIAYDEAMREVIEFARRDGATLVVATSDHETGGLTVGRDGVYDWNPAALAPIRRSLEAMGPDLRTAAGAADAESATAALRRVAEDAGYGPFSETEVAALAREVAAGWDSQNRASMVAARVTGFLQDLASRRALLGWTTGGHTAVDVPLYAFGPGSERFVGRFDNWDLGRRLARELGLEVGAGY